MNAESGLRDAPALVAPISPARARVGAASWRGRLAGLAIALAIHLAAVLWVSLSPAVAERPTTDLAPLLYLNVWRSPALPQFAPRTPSPPQVTRPDPGPVPDKPPIPEPSPVAAPSPPPAPPPSPPPRPPPPPSPAPAQIAMTAPPAPPIPAAPASPPLLDQASPFQAEVLARLAQARRYPATAMSLREQGVTAVRFRMTRGGAVSQAAIARSSGWYMLDQEALDMLRRVRLPPIPADLPDPLVLEVNMEFRLP